MSLFCKMLVGISNADEKKSEDRNEIFCFQGLQGVERHPLSVLKPKECNYKQKIKYSKKKINVLAWCGI